jgi:thiamine pyrophosphokinase
MKPYTGKVELHTEVNETISLYGIDAKTRITSSGLKYPLKNISLPFGRRESTSNVALKDKVQLKITGGIILLVRNISVLKRNDFFRHS